MNNVIITFEDGRINTFYFGKLSAITVTPEYLEMRIVDKGDVEEGICKYTYKHKIVGVEITYDKQENKGTDTKN